MAYKVSVVIERDADGYYAYVPELQGCQSQGDTLDEVLANIKEATELFLESLSKAEREALLKQQIFTTSVEVDVA